MSGVDYLVLTLLGYVSVPVAALVMRKTWPTQLRFLLASALALGAAVVQVLISGAELGTENIMLAFGPLFTAQQATFHLQIPGAGTPEVVERLEEAGI